MHFHLYYGHALINTTLKICITITWSFQRQPFKGVLRKRCSENLPENTHAEATLLKSHFRMGVLLQICCIFSAHLFLRTPLMGCFWVLHCATLSLQHHYDVWKRYHITMSLQCQHRSTSWWKSNKKPMLPQHRMPTGTHYFSYLLCLFVTHFLSIASFYSSWKHHKNKFSHVFRGHKEIPVACNESMNVCFCSKKIFGSLKLVSNFYFFTKW